ncbi:MAG: MG2 domain-containing protein [Candidatus Competibacteraceae bacterium]
MIEEQQVFVLALDAEAVPETILEHVRCVVTGLAEPLAVDFATGSEQAKVLAAIKKVRIAGEVQRAALQCRQALPPEAKVELSWDAGARAISGIATDQRQALTFEVRPPFTAHAECQDVAAGDGYDKLSRITSNCHPAWSLQVVFSTPIAAERAAALRLRGPDRVYAPVSIDRKKEFLEPLVEIVRFAGPFPEQAQLILEMPADLTDESKRPLANAAQFPLTIATGRPPPVVQWAGGDILESRIHPPLLPVVLRYIKGEISGRWFTVGAGEERATGQPASPDRQDQTIIQWLRRVHETPNTPSLFDASTPVHPFTVPKLGGRLEVAGIPLAQSGFYVVKLDSPVVKTTTVLVTNLSVQFKTGDEGPSLVWVSTLDTAQPVKGAAVAVRDACDGKLLWQGRTGKDGIARIDTVLPPGSADASCKQWRGLFISARAGEELSFTRVDDRLDSRSPPSPTVHTILDRTLFRAGETVSMKHILRRAVLAGFAIPATGRPDKITITHLGSDESHELPLRWDRYGIAESAWPIPKDAKLGRYLITPGDLSRIYALTGS